MTGKTEVNLEELKKGGIVKLREKDMFSVWVRAVCDNMDAKKLRKVAGLAEKYGRGYILFSTRQFPIIPHVHFKDIGSVKEELKEIDLEFDRCGKRVRNADVCYDANLCPYAVMDPISLGEKLDQFWREDKGGFKIKTSIVGCEKQCTSPRVLADIGFVGTERGGEKGFDAFLGGKLGLDPFVGVRMAELLSEAECVRFVKNYIKSVRKEGREGERAGDLIRRLGEGEVRKAVTCNLRERCVTEPHACDTKQRVKMDRTTLRIRATNGEVTSRQLKKVADITEAYGLGFVHFSVRGAPEIPGVKPGDTGRIREELRIAGMEPLEKGVDNLQSCFGGYCVNGVFDAQALLVEIEKIVKKLDLNSLNIKISASGCPNSCGISHLSDIGFTGVMEPGVDEKRCDGCGICLRACRTKAIEVKDHLAEIDIERCKNCGLCIRACPFDAIYEKRKGIAILAGGRGPCFMHDEQTGGTRLGEKIVDFVTDEKALQIAEEILRFLKETNKKAADLIDEIGLGKFKEEVGAFS
ncbi:MAG: 4Fe-4S binding protein [Thermodesulfobacteriota bacterium]|nr:4Fe-4S binding protein [Thermodesulfobacteriota bacterium]